MRKSGVMGTILVVAGTFVSSDSAFAQVNYNVIAGFDQSVGAATQPTTGVIKGSDGAFYGTTQNSNFCGAIYRLSADGTERKILHVFHGYFATPPDGPDGCQPQGELVEVGDFLYGTTLWGGENADQTFSSSAVHQLRICTGRVRHRRGLHQCVLPTAIPNMA